MSGLWLPGPTVMETTVVGRPRTKGSLKHRGNGRLVDSPQSSDWRRLMAKGFHLAYGSHEPQAGPVIVEMIFSFAMTAEQVVMITTGDVDKLERNVLDALKDGMVIRDDRLVVRTNNGKIPSDRQGVWVRVRPAEWVEVAP